MSDTSNAPTEEPRCRRQSKTSKTLAIPLQTEAPVIQNLIEDVRLFHQTFGHPIVEKPTIPSPERQVLRSKLIRDEYQGEFDPAWCKCAALRKALTDQELASPGGQHDTIEALAEFGDAIADVIYFLIGTAHEYGIPLAQIWQAVQEANMSKLWTEQEVDTATIPDGWRATIAPHTVGQDARYLVYDETGKVRKPPSWKEPDITSIIRKAMQ
jgi:predicted HAD superfamily Cof-like phosphohydrolase